MTVWDLITAGCYLMLTWGMWKITKRAAEKDLDGVGVVAIIAALALTLLPLIRLLQ